MWSKQCFKKLLQASFAFFHEEFNFGRILKILLSSVGTRSACVNAATLALADAGIPMRDIVTSCSAGYLNSTPLLGTNMGWKDELDFCMSILLFCFGSGKPSFFLLFKMLHCSQELIWISIMIWTDLNYVEDSAGGPDVTVGFLPKLDKVTLLQVINFYSFFFFSTLICSSVIL